MREELPEGWCDAPLLDCCEIIRGVSYAKGEAETQPKNGLIPLLRANNIAEELVFRDLQYVPANRVNSQQMLREEDVVVAMSSGSKAVVGKGAQLRGGWAGTFGAFCGVLRPTSQIEPRYFGVFFRTHAYRHAISEASAGTNINNLKRGYFEALLLPLPPLVEQQRIVAKVEALLARVNAARQRLATVPAILKRFRQSVLAAACSGRLTADWREADSCLVQPEGLEHQESVPEGWPTRKLREFTNKLEQGWSPQCEIDPSPSVDTWGVIKTTAVQPLQFMQEENKRLPDYLKSRPALELKAGDLLITRAGPRVRAGVACLVQAVRPRLIVCDKVYRFRVDEKVVLPAFVALALNTPAMLELIDTLKTGISDSGVNLTQEKFLDLELALPHLAEQREIVRRVEALFRLADAIEKRVAAATARAEKLTQAILAKAFRGELVPNEAELARREGRSYEPASVLLDRIRAERADGPAPQQHPARRRKP